MLQAFVNETKSQDGHTKRPQMPLPERERYPFSVEASGHPSLTGNGSGSTQPSMAVRNRSAVGSLQRLYGNQAVLQMRNGSGGASALSMPLRPSQSGILQRKCTCGGSADMLGKCKECGNKKKLGLQTRLKINEPGDAYEQEADRIADQVMAVPQRPAASFAPLRIQRLAAQPADPVETAPASVDRALASSGGPLDPALRQDMEMRFGHDFSPVRIHADADADRSARDINAHAYTAGHHIVFGRGRYAPETERGRQLLAHELTHVVQQGGESLQRARTSAKERAGGAPLGREKWHFNFLSAGGVVARQPADEPAQAPERICVPGSSPDSPECVAWERKRKQLERERSTPVAPDAGLKVPAHPDAVKGIHEWSAEYAAPTNATVKNRFDVGKYRLQQVVTFDASGQSQVYMYYTFDRTDPDDKYAVGPDSLTAFAILYGGGKIVALPGNRDDLSTGPKTVDARKLPPAPDAVREEPNLYYVVPTLPAYDVRGDPFMAGKYYMVPYLRHLPNGQLTVLYWIAENTQAHLRPEIFVGPEWLDFFVAHLDMYANMAWLSYPREGMPAAYQVHSARFVYGTFKGDPERARSGLKAWKAAAKDPGWWAQVVMNYASAGVPAPTSTGPPNLTVVQGGGGGAATATSTATTTVTTASQAPVVVGGGTALAVKVSPAPVVAQAPVVASRPLVGLPTNPNPMPITPVSPPSPVASAIVTSVLQGVSAQTGVNVNPAARPQPSPQPEEQRTCPYATGLTPADPIPMRWFKPRHDSFYRPTLALNGGTLERDNPNAALPDGTRVGVQDRFWPRLGKVMQMWPGFRTGAERQFRRLLARWGYQWEDTEQCDHVQDPQWCGPDEVYGGNFWPLEKSTNQSAGPTQNNFQFVTFCPSPTAYPAVNWPIQDMKNAGYYGRYFTIQEVLLVSNSAPGLTRVWYRPAGRPTCHDGSSR